MKKITAILLVAAFARANATPLLTDAGLTDTVTFDEASVGSGVSVTDQYNARGVTFSTGGPGQWYASGNPGTYSSIANFSGTYLDSFSGGTGASVYSINFGTTASAAGAWFEFNISSPAATFSAYLDNVLQESYTYNNLNCCSSAEFLGFTGRFDEIRISEIRGGAFIMDTVRYTRTRSVPEPGTIALLAAGLFVVGLARGTRNS